MRPSAFEYHRAQSLEQALSLLAEFGDEGRPIAGGQSLVPMMNLRLARPEHLIDINGLGLDAIERRGDRLHMGALVRHVRYAQEPAIARHFPALLDAAGFIGHPTIRRHGSLGGSISHADPTAELPAACLLYDAEIVAASAAGERRIAARDFFVSAFVTALEPGEMVTGVDFPLPAQDGSGAFVELGERQGDFAIAAAGATLSHAGGRITAAGIVCAGAELTPIRAPEAEAALIGRPLAAPEARDLAEAFARTTDPMSDLVASADYRRGLIAELIRRAIERACERAAQ